MGDHIKKRRLDLKLSRRQAAARIGITKSTLWDWENNRSTPAIHTFPKVIAFLGYDPCPAPETEGERIAAKRRQLGLSRKGLARMLGIDQETVARWETDEPKGSQTKRRLLVKRLLEER